MSVLRRSTTGCAACKSRRKKCDEAKPQCQRCVSSGRTCSYEYVEYPESDKHRVKRTKPAPRSASEQLASQSLPVALSDDSLGSPPIPPPTLAIYGDTTRLASSTPLQAQNNSPIHTSSRIIPQGFANSLSPPPVLVPSRQRQWSGIDPNGLPHVYHILPNASIPTSQSSWTDFDDHRDDPERVQALLCVTPVLDKNTSDNTLSFVLQCYSQWAIVSVFEPLKIVQETREQIFTQFSSESTRMRTILIANVMEMFANNFTIDGKRKSILDRLALDVRKTGAAFMAAPPSSIPELDRLTAMHTLDSMLEILGLQLDTQPMSDSVRSLEYVTPIFLRACVEPLGYPINLPNILLNPSLNLRHFAVIDIMMSVTTGRPTLVRYEVPFSLELCEHIFHWQLQGNYGLQWLYGLPDQFALLLAWTSSLSEMPGKGDNSELTAWIERLLPQIRVAADQSGDALLRIRRMVVLESWRFAVIVHLYMVLCKADARDPRVIKAQKGFMRLINGVKPGRNPDIHLVMPMIVVGVAITEEQDRETIRQRILNLPECSRQGTAGNDNLLTLEDVWYRTKGEGRAAVWSDLGIAYSRISER